MAGEGGEKLKCHPAVGCRREKQEDKREKHTDGGGKKYSQEGERAQGRRRAKGHGSKSGGRWKDPATPHPCSPSHSPVTPDWLAAPLLASERKCDKDERRHFRNSIATLIDAAWSSEFKCPAPSVSPLHIRVALTSR